MSEALLVGTHSENIFFSIVYRQFLYFFSIIAGGSKLLSPYLDLLKRNKIFKHWLYWNSIKYSFLNFTTFELKLSTCE